MSIVGCTQSRESRTSAGRVGALLAIAVFGCGVPAAGQTLHNEDGIRLRATIRVLAYGAGRCEVSEPNHTEEMYERLRGNIGQPIDVWEVEVTAYNGSGRELSELGGVMNIEAESPPCDSWSREADVSGFVHQGGALMLLTSSGSVGPGEAVTETRLLAVFHTDDDPVVASWDIQYVFSGGADRRQEARRSGSSQREAGRPADRTSEPPPQRRAAETPARRSRPAARPAAEPAPRRDPVAPRPGDTMTGPAGMEFGWVPAGEFRMGSTSGEADSDEQPVTRVRISRGFWLGKYEVTRSEWQAVMGSNPSSFDWCGRCPVEQVSWEDVQQFIRRLNSQEGREMYRLPTEAEWEYAARAGTAGDRYGSVDAVAWYGNNSESRTHEVGRKTPNAWGLYDMLGNVNEWVQDWYGAYPGGSVTDPRGPGSGSSRVDRGGSWVLGGARYVRAPNRAGDHPGDRPPRPGLSPAEDTITLGPFTLVPSGARSAPSWAGSGEGRRGSARAERETARPASGALEV